MSSIPPNELTIAAEPPDGLAASHCIAEYYRELRARFDEGFDPALSTAPSLDEFGPPRGVFLIARLGGQPIGCGGLKPLSAGAAYLKRMWIAPAARGRGLARTLLAALENTAAELGYSSICLETHRSLAEAQHLYRSARYVEVEPFNDEPYADHWFEKRLVVKSRSAPPA